MEPTTTGYVDLDQLHLYYETYGSGTPLVLLHGGMMTIDLNFASLIPTLAERHQVIGIEAQGHGRTNDTGRPINPANFAGDVVAVLDHLGIDRAYLLGHSQGAATTIQLAIAHPDRVLGFVPCSGSVRPSGMHPDLSDPSTYATSTRMPTMQDMNDFAEAYQRLSPHPDHFDDFLASLSASQADVRGWSDEELAGIAAPSLWIMGDHDFVTVDHGAQILELVPNSQLAVLPGTTHMQVTRRADLLLPMLADFLSQ